MNDYEKNLSVVCPRCSAAIGGKCLEPHRGKTGIAGCGSSYIDTPHPERLRLIELQEQELNKMLYGG